MTDSIVTCPRCGAVVDPKAMAQTARITCVGCGATVDMRPPESDSGDSRWRVLGEDGREYGPITRAELQHWLDEGRISSTCFIADTDQRRWKSAPELFPSLPQSPSKIGSAAYQSSRPGAADSPGRPSLLAAILLSLLGPFAGLSGLHRFYLGHITIGILMLITCGGCGIWQLIDIIILASGNMRDTYGRLPG